MNYRGVAISDWINNNNDNNSIIREPTHHTLTQQTYNYPIIVISYALTFKSSLPPKLKFKVD